MMGYGVTVFFFPLERYVSAMLTQENSKNPIASIGSRTCDFPCFISDALHLSYRKHFG